MIAHTYNCLCAGAIGLGNGLFSDANVPDAGKSNVECDGSESRLADCSYDRVFGDSCETSSAVCQGEMNM